MHFTKSVTFKQGSTASEGLALKGPYLSTKGALYLS